MTKFLYTIIEWIARIHEKLLSVNDSYELFLNDKQLHFIVIGLLGMAMIFALHPLFTYLAKNDHVLVISWLYVFTLIIVLSFAIEIGQRIGGQGTMEFADILFGIAGFLLFFALFAVVRGLVRFLWRSFQKRE